MKLLRRNISEVFTTWPSYSSDPIPLTDLDHNLILWYILCDSIRLRMTRSSLADIHGMAKYTMGKSSAEIRAKKSCERKKAVGKTLFSIVVVFVICWSPTVIFMLIMDTAPKIVPTEQVPIVFTNQIGCANSIWCQSRQFYYLDFNIRRLHNSPCKKWFNDNEVYLDIIL